ncbi:MAG: TyeA family type III secretion system gatekeeper subunit [Oxalobacteraceae bacterium]|nr:TyeA family type III secretion system gatekeeper subunit [Oxalobacteraceae bacterium]
MSLPLPELDIDHRKLLLALVKTVSGAWISPNQFERLARELTIPDGPATIYFLTGIKQILRELPFKVFTDDAARTAILDAVQTAIDAAIEREENSGSEEIKS